MDEIEVDLSNWMAKLPTEMQKIPIRQLAIPGSHDSGAYFLDKNSPIAPDEGSTVQKLAKWFGCCAKRIIYRWSITQELCIYDQLMQGVRYLDLRVAYEKSTKSFCYVHGLYGLPYESIFKEIEDFLVKHPKEVLILDFNHLWDFTQEQCNTFMKLIEDNFSHWLYGPGMKGAKCSLQDVWGSNKRIIALYEDDPSTKISPLLWPSKHIYSPWYNTADVDQLIADLNKRFDDIKDDCFNVFQAILSPQTSTIILHLIGSLKGELAEKCDDHVCSWLQKLEEEKKKNVNIVICDFIELYQLPSKIIAINYTKTKNKVCSCNDEFDIEIHSEK